MSGPNSPAYRIEALNIAGGLIAIAMMSLLWFALWALIFRAVPESNRDALMVVIGILSMNVGQVINFFFGSSSTNKKQAETIDKQASTLQAAQAALAPVIDAPTVTLAPGDTATVKADNT